ncbi:hypothetical protein [[Mycobacterium] zoologicum]|uniref:hypothetical protein n=1 Tax=[Mycobacterium] zoologicum TaxID=2872311 RepID=UPI001CDAAC10|nr:hypothetical protein [Mycolicibacter sp. MYC101]MEB3062471.1 hypothetical protein [Mycolicibacter sp. MYC101]
MAHPPIPYELTDDGADYDSADYPVDSTYYPCCNAIGQHASTCNTQAPLLPIGATRAGEFDPEDGIRLIQAHLEPFELHAEQDRTGNLANVVIFLDQAASENGLDAAHFRELIPTLRRVAELADKWTSTTWGEQR